MSNHKVHLLVGPGPEQRMLFNTESNYKFVNPIRLDTDAGLLALQALVHSRSVFTLTPDFFLVYKITGLSTCAASLRWFVNANHQESFHHHLVPVSDPLLYKVSCLQHSNSVLRKTNPDTKAYGAFSIFPMWQLQERQALEPNILELTLWSNGIPLPVDGNGLFRAKINGGNSKFYERQQRRIFFRPPKTLVGGN